MTNSSDLKNIQNDSEAYELRNINRHINDFPNEEEYEQLISATSAIIDQHADECHVHSTDLERDLPKLDTAQKAFEEAERHLGELQGTVSLHRSRLEAAENRKWRAIRQRARYERELADYRSKSPAGGKAWAKFQDTQRKVRERKRELEAG